MKLKATESTAVKLFASYKRKGMTEDKAMASPAKLGGRG